MNGTYRQLSILLLLLASRLLGFGAIPCSEPAEACPHINVRLYNYAKVPTDDMLAAKQEAMRVLRQAGIKTIWVDCALVSDEAQSYAACDERLSPADVVLRILAPSGVPQWARGTAVFGYALPAKASGFGTVANVFHHRVEALSAELRTFSVGRVFCAAVILGHLIAHELGHLLLGANSHSRTGIMQFPWDRDVLRLTTRGSLLFTGRQAKKMRVQVEGRVRASRGIAGDS